MATSSDSRSPDDATRVDVAQQRTPAGAARVSMVRDPDREIPSWRPGNALVPTERYGRFEVLGRVGRGGMAEILLARERSIAGSTRHLVIKRILPEVVEHGEMLEMFLDEARVVMGLSHPNVCQIYEVGSQDGTWYIAMEWVHGVTLHELIRRGSTRQRLDFPMMARVIAQCAEALHHAHTARDAEGRALQLVHRDVSPHNIMVGFDGRVKLLDFGIAKTSTSTHVTESGIVKGKVCYMAPEQWLSGSIDARTDVFALGACLYEALTGNVVFRRESQTEVMRAILHEGAPALAEVAPQVPAKLAKIVARALARAPDARFQSGLEMAEALEQFLTETTESATAAKLALYARGLFRAEVEQGPVLERSLRAGYWGEESRFAFPPPGAALRASFAPSLSEPAKAAQQLPRPQLPMDLPGPSALSAAPTPRAGGSLPAFQPLVVAGSLPASAQPPLPAPQIQLPSPTLPLGTPAVKTTSSELREAPHEELPESDSYLPPTSSGEIEASPLAPTLPFASASARRIAWVLLPAACALLAALYGGVRWYESDGATADSTAPDTDRAAAMGANTAPETRPAHALRSEGPLGQVLLSIDTEPWSTVSVDGVVLGTTPILDAVVPDGPLTLKLVDASGKVHIRTLNAPRSTEREVFFELGNDK